MRIVGQKFRKKKQKRKLVRRQGKLGTRVLLVNMFAMQVTRYNIARSFYSQLTAYSSRFLLCHDQASTKYLPGRLRKPKAFKLWRPKRWCEKVVNNYRLQSVGWKDIYEYRETHGEPDRWENDYLKCLRVKKTGYYTYWTSERECVDRYVSRVKMYEYQNTQARDQ